MRIFQIFLLFLCFLPLGAAPTMTNDWFGYGQCMRNHGFRFDVNYTYDIAANLAGGKNRGWAQSGSLGICFELDLGHIMGWTGWDLFNSWVFRTGNNLSTKKIDNQFTVQQNYGGQNMRLNELFIRNISPDKRFLFKAGRLDEGNDFLASALYGYYVNNAFCGNPVSVFINGPYTAYPNATWGSYFSARPVPRLLIKGAIYNANSMLSENSYHGMNFVFKNTNGVQLTTEWCYINNPVVESYGYTGHYKLGIFYYTGKFGRFAGGSTKGNYGYYFLFDQVIYRKGDPCSTIGLTAFVNGLFAPYDRNKMPVFSNGGLLYKGLFKGRPEDVIAFGYVYGSYSRALRRVEQEAKDLNVLGPFGNLPQTHESVLELNYTVQVNEWLRITPDLQYILNPKGYGLYSDAFVVSCQLNAIL